MYAFSLACALQEEMEEITFPTDSEYCTRHVAPLPQFEPEFSLIHSMTVYWSPPHARYFSKHLGYTLSPKEKNPCACESYILVEEDRQQTINLSKKDIEGW